MRENKEQVQGVTPSSRGHSAGLRPEPVPVSAVPAAAVNAFTPGPWVASDARYPNRPIVRMARVNGAHGVFTKIADINAGLNEANANARLIAAAPDLYEALRDYVDFLEPRLMQAVEAGYPNEPHVERLNRAKAALSKVQP